MDELKLVDSFQASLFDTSKDVAKKWAENIVEVGIDSLMENELVKSIPVVGTVFELAKFGLNLYARNLNAQLVTFINEFNSGTVDKAVLDKHKKALENTKSAEAELGRVLFLLNSNIDIDKSRYEAKFYRAYVYERISWEQFCELCDITNRLYIYDVDVLKETFANHGVNAMKVSYRHKRLMSIGLLAEVNGGGSLIAIEEGDNNPKVMEITTIGQLFCEYAFK